MSQRPFELHGHRGARGLWPENTLAGFTRTVALGVSALEIDVGFTRDDVPVVHHDYMLSPHSARRDGKWIKQAPPLRTLSLAELSDYDVGRLDPASDYAGQFPHQLAVDGERVPTLGEVLDLALAAGNEALQFNIEAKSTPLVADLTAPPALIAEHIVAAIDARGLRERCMVSSFDWRVVLAAQALAPDLHLGVTTVEQSWYDTLWRDRPQPSPWLAGTDLAACDGSVPKLAARLGIGAWVPYYGEVTEENVAQAHALGLRVIVWTVNGIGAMRRLIALGIDGITTDYPDRLRTVAGAAGVGLPPSVPHPQ